MLLIVSDGASEEMLHQHDVVLEVLASLGAADKPKIDVINKIDLLQTPPQWPGALPISAKTGEGIDALLAALPSSRSIMALLRSLESPCLPAEIGVDGKLLKNTFLYCKEVRARYTILQLVWDLGLLDSLSDQVIAGLGE